MGVTVIYNVNEAESKVVAKGGKLEKVSDWIALPVYNEEFDRTDDQGYHQYAIRIDGQWVGNCDEDYLSAYFSNKNINDHVVSLLDKYNIEYERTW